MDGFPVDLIFLINIGIVTLVTSMMVIAYLLGHFVGKQKGKEEGKK